MKSFFVQYRGEIDLKLNNLSVWQFSKNGSIRFLLLVFIKEGRSIN